MDTAVQGGAIGGALHYDWDSIVAAIMVVKIGTWLLTHLGIKLAHAAPKNKVGEPDWFTQRYRGRLPGARKMGTQGKGGTVAYGPGTGISARGSGDINSSECPGTFGG
eukprot:11235919-Karenia_brevis.AAC.1